MIFKLFLHRLHKVFKLGKDEYRNNYWLEIPLYLGTVLYLLVLKRSKQILKCLCFILDFMLKVFYFMYSLGSCSWICKSTLGYVKKKLLYPCLARQADTFMLLIFSLCCLPSIHAISDPSANYQCLHFFLQYFLNYCSLQLQDLLKKEPKWVTSTTMVFNLWVGSLKKELKHAMLILCSSAPIWVCSSHPWCFTITIQG